MPKQFSLERPSCRDRETVRERIKEASEVKPRLTFVFPINERRERALEAMASELKMPEQFREAAEASLALLRSGDDIEQMAALQFLAVRRDVVSAAPKEFVSELRAIAQSSAGALRQFGDSNPRRGDDPWFEIDRVRLVLAGLGAVGKEALAAIDEICEYAESIIGVDCQGAKLAAKVRGVGAEEGLAILRAAIQDFSHRNAAIAAVEIARREYGEAAMPMLRQAMDSVSSAVAYAVADALGAGIPQMPTQRIMSLAREILHEEFGLKEEDILRKAVWELKGRPRDEVEPFLEELLRSDGVADRWRISDILEVVGTVLLDLREQKAESRDQREAVVERLYKEFPVLRQRRLLHARASIEESAAIDWERRGQASRHLLSSRKTLFATPDVGALQEQFVRIQRVVDILAERYADAFVGIVVYGSREKGYAEQDSDVDLATIGLPEKFSGAAKDLFMENDIPFCLSCYRNVDASSGVDSNDASALFHGVFFGDTQKLAVLRRNVFHAMSEEQWERVRRLVFREETHMGKAAARFGLGEDELRLLAPVIALQKVPPPYEETRAIVERRAQEAEQAMVRSQSQNKGG